MFIMLAWEQLNIISANEIYKNFDELVFMLKKKWSLAKSVDIERG